MCLLFIVTLKDTINICIGGLISWVLSRHFYSKSISRPQYKIRSDYITADEFKEAGVSIRHGESTLESFSISRFALWNNGNSIKQSDMADNSPICLYVKDNEKIIDAQLLYAEKENGFKIEQTDNKITIKFDFIAKNQGIVLKIFHTGKDGDSLLITGAFKDGRKITEEGQISSRKMIPYRSIRNFKFRQYYRIIQITLASLMAIFSLSTIYLFLTQDNEILNKLLLIPSPENSTQLIHYRTFFFVFSCAYLALSFIVIFNLLKRSRHKMPKEIEHAFEGINVESNASDFQKSNVDAKEQNQSANNLF